MEIKTILENNILSDTLSLYWKGNDFYPASNIKFEKNELENVGATQVFVSYRENEESSASDLEFELIRTVVAKSLNASIFAIDHKAFLKSKIRNFKGVIPEIKEDKLQNEIYIEDNLSILAELVNLKKDDFNFAKYLNASENSFILLSNKCLINQQVLDIACSFVELNSVSKIDYLNLITYFINSDLFVLKTRNFPNDNIKCFQIFYCKKYSEYFDESFIK